MPTSIFAAAVLAALKGMFILQSFGNEGDEDVSGSSAYAERGGGIV